MPDLRRLSGLQVAGILEGFGFQIVSQSGSHLKLRRIGPEGQKQTLTIPRHKELDKGTLRAVLRQAARYVPECELRRSFVAE